ncbi:MAG TPA: DUF1961 family protein [Terriglobia bacterium]|nr:DUF1961 family protein [Terriglobia bacterium]
MKERLVLDRRSFLQTSVAGGVASLAEPRKPAAASAPVPERLFQTVPTPPPSFSYPAGDSSIRVLHPSGRYIEHGGRRGLHFTSIRGRAGLPRHTVAARKGSVVFWVLPLQEISPQAHNPAHEQSNPFYKNFVFLTDREAVEDLAAANFCLFQATDWYPALTARFGNDDRWGHPIAKASANYFEFLPHNWYQITATWDRDKGDFRVYANGILVAASNAFAPTPGAGDSPAPTVYFGNPGYAMGQIDFFDQILTPAQIQSLFVKNGGRTDTDLQRTLETRYTGNHLSPFSPPAMKGDGWVERKKLSLTDSAQDAEFFHQGCGPCLRYNSEGLRITTPSLEAHFRQTGKYDLTRMYLWTRDVFQGDLHVTAEFKIHQHGGLALWMFQAAGMQGEDFLNDYQLRSDGSMQVVCWEDVRNYHWEFYREMVDTRNDLVSHAVIKNPWFCPVAFQMENRQWELDRWYRVTFLQEDNRLRGAIDDVTIFDVRDNGLTNNGPVMRQGRVALRLMMRSDMTFRNLEIATRPDYS